MHTEPAYYIYILTGLLNLYIVRSTRGPYFVIDFFPESSPQNEFDERRVEEK